MLEMQIEKTLLQKKCHKPFNDEKLLWILNSVLKKLEMYQLSCDFLHYELSKYSTLYAVSVSLDIV